MMTDEDQIRLRRYLLGQLPDDQQIAVEERLLSDADFYEHLEIVESELIDTYVVGTITPEDRDAFDKHFLCTRKRYAELEVARHLSKQFAPPESGPSPVVSIRKSGFRRWMPQLAVAACLLVTVAATLVSFWSVRERDAIAEQARAASDLVSRQKAEIERLSARITEFEKAGLRSVSNLVTLLLTPGFASRSQGQASLPVLRLPNAESQVRLQVELPADLEGPDVRTYTATLIAGGKQIWKLDRIPAGSVEKRRLTLNLPPRLLSSEDYHLRLTSLSANGEIYSQADYDFRCLVP